ncbi:MAG TPA: ASCH/PUA domain-containing protein [Abditibacterium sp.]|jgi:hypothetical protein
MKHHFLKTWPKHFDAVARGEKTFEARKNDRDFQVGDTLTLQRFDQKTGQFTGAEIDKRISHILHGGAYGIAEGHCILSLQEVSDAS